MQILFNGVQQEVAEKVSVADLVKEYAGIAVAVNEKVVPRDSWEKKTLAPNDRIDVIAPYQGG
ncbi:MAG: hypothetical protein S4CHLAM2_06370 [Chlamydiales bacterium]|nr:hypothetical protein [Chlamydiales bacterium]